MSSAGSPPNAQLAPRRDAAAAVLAPPCGVRALAIRALDKTALPGASVFCRRRVTAVVAGRPGRPCGPRRIARGSRRRAFSISERPKPAAACFSKVMLHSKVSDPPARWRCARWRRRSEAWLARRNGRRVKTAIFGNQLALARLRHLNGQSDVQERSAAAEGSLRIRTQFSSTVEGVVDYASTCWIPTAW